MSRSISFRSAPLTEIFVDGDENRVIRLDLADVGVLTRFHEAVPRMDDIDASFRELSEQHANDNVDIHDYAVALADAEKQLAEIINGIFNADVVGPAANGASLFTPVDGLLLYEVIVSVLADQYGDELKRQAELRQKRISKHTAKYSK